jgi:steroid delta-isomerase-like uncharacterized protein
MDISPSCLMQIEPYFKAWNAHDPGAVAAAFTEDGTYTDPTVAGPPLTSAALAEHVQALFAGFPDLAFVILSAQPMDGGASGGTVVARWLMRGTNTGPLRGLPPSGRSVALPGVDLITIADGKIGSVEGYFDRQTMAEQLGLQVLVQPHAAGPFQFGYAVRATTGSTKVPAAVSLTWIDARSEEEADQVRAISRPLAAELAKAPGFISWLGVGIASRLFTITAWESEDAIKQAMRNNLHTGAIKRFFTEDFGAAVGTGIWSVHHLNPLWVRCPSCARVTDRAQAASCTCGQQLPESPQRW